MVLDFMKDFACLWNTNSEHYGNKRVRDNAVHEILQLKFMELTTEGVQIKVTTVRTGYVVQLANAINSEQSGAGLRDICVPELFSFKQAHSYLRDVSVSRNSDLKKALSFAFFKFIN